jgi:Amt family ammonium transporter
MMNQLGIQAIGVIATAVWCGILTWIILKVVDMLVGVRVSEEEETEGLDHVCHDETGYNDI